MLARRASGVSLIELVVVIVALSIGMVILGSAFLSSARSVSVNEDVQITWQVAQACADHVLGRVRRPGAYANVDGSSDPCTAINANGTTGCAVGTQYVSVENLASGAGPCTVGPCRRITVCARRNGYDAKVLFMFVDA